MWNHYKIHFSVNTNVIYDKARQKTNSLFFNPFNFINLTSLFLLAGTLLGNFGNEGKVFAQIIPDNTLDRENSIVNPQGGQNNITVTGGAIRDTTLFHSFQEFNINETQRVYFTNPNGVFNILTRVTGNNISRILGTLGVRGNANFFLINPNGIYFGENIKLDLNGSFTATTADSIFLDSFEFSAARPEIPPLLKININPGIQYGRNDRDREIHNIGDLSVDFQQNLTLFGGSIVNTGNLTALGGKIEVLGEQINLSDDSQIDVSTSTGGGTILIGGNYQGRGSLPTANRVYIGKDVLIDADAVGEIGNGGKVIIWADEMTGFYGEINARGGFKSGNGGFVEVSGKEYLIFSGFVDVSAVNGKMGTILLDPRNITISDAPNSPLVIPALSDDRILVGELPNTDINIQRSTLEMLSGNIILEATENIIIEPGVDLNFTMADSITLRANADKNESGDFLMNAGNRILTNGEDLEIRGNNLILGSLNTTKINDDGGSISLIAAGNISTRDLRSGSIFSDNAGEIDILSNGGSIAVFGTINAHSPDDRANRVRLVAEEDIRISNPSFFEPAIDTRGDEKGGDITLVSQNGMVSLTNADLMSGTREGDAGDITIVGHSIEIENSIITSQLNQQGQAGTISLEGSESISLENSSLITNISLGVVGMPGNISMNAQQVTLNNSNAIARSGGLQNLGNIEISATSLNLQNASNIEVFSPSHGGNINITATDLDLSDRSQLKTQTEGINDGNINIDVENLTMRNNSSIFTTVRSATGTGGKIEINASGFITAIFAENSDIFTNGEQGRRGDLTVTARTIFGFNIGDNLTGESDILGTVEVVFDELAEFDEFDDEFDDDFDNDDARNPLALRQPREEFVQQCGINGQNELAIAGRSGMRTNPSQILRGREIWEDRRDFSTPQNATETEEIETNETNSIIEPLIEARGWKINESGNLELIGEQLSINYYQCTIHNAQ